MVPTDTAKRIVKRERGGAGAEVDEVHPAGVRDGLALPAQEVEPQANRWSAQTARFAGLEPREHLSLRVARQEGCWGAVEEPEAEGPL